MCWLLKAASIWWSEFGVIFMEADTSYSIYITLVIPGYPVEYVYLHTSTDVRSNPLVCIAWHCSVLMTKTVQWQLSPSIKLKFS